MNHGRRAGNRLSAVTFAVIHADDAQSPLSFVYARIGSDRGKSGAANSHDGRMESRHRRPQQKACLRGAPGTRRDGLWWRQRWWRIAFTCTAEQRAHLHIFGPGLGRGKRQRSRLPSGDYRRAARCRELFHCGRRRCRVLHFRGRGRTVVQAASQLRPLCRRQWRQRLRSDAERQRREGQHKPGGVYHGDERPRRDCGQTHRHRAGRAPRHCEP